MCHRKSAASSCAIWLWTSRPFFTWDRCRHRPSVRPSGGGGEPRPERRTRYLDPAQADGGRHRAVQRVVLLHVRPHHEHLDTAAVCLFVRDETNLRPVLCVGVEAHDLGEGDVLVLMEGSGVGRLVGVVDGERGAAGVVDEPRVAGRLAWVEG